MDQTEKTGTSRRHFLTTVVPACAVTCMGFKMALAQDKAKAPADGKETAEDVHPFDAKFPRKLSYRQFYRARYREAIELAKALKEEMGEEKAIEFMRETPKDQPFLLIMCLPEPHGYV